MLDGLEGTNGFAMVELVVGHVDIAGTRAVELDEVGEMAVVVVAAVVLSAKVDTVALVGKGDTSILLTLYLYNNYII